MNLFQTYQAKVEAALKDIAASGGLGNSPDLSRVTVEPPRDPSHGDLSTNAAMVLAKAAGRRPRELAIELAAALARDPEVENAEVAGPGFLNLRLAPWAYEAVLRSALSDGEAYGRSSLGAGRRVNVEYVSANPTGPLHVGHARGAVFGDALASLLAFAGWEVTREYYVNDAGGQVAVLAASALHRAREAAGEDVGPVPEGLYPGDYLRPVGEALAREGVLALPDGERKASARAAAIDAMMTLIRDDLAALGIRHEVFFRESSLTGERDLIAHTIAWLRERGLVYQGRLDPPKGQLPEDWENREQTLFRATAFGDDVDRPLVKADGSYTYFAADLAYHADKIARGFPELVDVLGADHGGYVKRMQAAVAAVGEGRVTLDVRLCQLVRLLRGGEPVKMSKRAGDFVTLREVVDEVGPDAVRFIMLTRRNDASLDFDLARVVEQSKDNPVFYVQYAHARACSVARQAAAALPGADLSDAALAGADLTRLTDPGEVTLLRRLAEWPRVIEAAAAAREPHRLAFHLGDLAAEFHAHWNRGKESPQLRFVNPIDTESTRARLALVSGVRTVLAAGLGVLGVVAPAEMR